MIHLWHFKLWSNAVSLIICNAESLWMPVSYGEDQNGYKILDEVLLVLNNHFSTSDCCGSTSWLSVMFTFLSTGIPKPFLQTCFQPFCLSLCWCTQIFHPHLRTLHLSLLQQITPVGPELQPFKLSVFPTFVPVSHIVGSDFSHLQKNTDSVSRPRSQLLGPYALSCNE